MLRLYLGKAVSPRLRLPRVSQKWQMDERTVYFFNMVIKIHAAVVTFVAGSLEAGGLPGYPEVS
jgi:hypothetical protein